MSEPAMGKEGQKISVGPLRSAWYFDITLVLGRKKYAVKRIFT